MRGIGRGRQWACAGRWSTGTATAARAPLPMASEGGGVRNTPSPLPPALKGPELQLCSGPEGKGLEPLHREWADLEKGLCGATFQMMDDSWGYGAAVAKVHPQNPNYRIGLYPLPHKCVLCGKPSFQEWV